MIKKTSIKLNNCSKNYNFASNFYIYMENISHFNILFTIKINKD